MYLIDTNILIYHFNNEIPEKVRPALRDILKNHFNISIISKMEFLGFKEHTAQTFQKASLFIGYANLVRLDNEIVETVIRLRRNHRIKLPDAIIAASAIKYRWTLVTRNEKDFQNIDMEIYNPFQP